MKTIEELKQEQYDLKAKLHELVEFTNNEEYFILNETERKMYNNLKIAVEMHLRCLSVMVHEDLNSPVVNIPDFSLIGTMMGMFSPSFNFPKAQLKESDFEVKEEKDE